MQSKATKYIGPKIQGAAGFNSPQRAVPQVAVAEANHRYSHNNSQYIRCTHQKFMNKRFKLLKPLNGDSLSILCCQNDLQGHCKHPLTTVAAVQFHVPPLVSSFPQLHYTTASFHRPLEPTDCCHPLSPSQNSRGLTSHSTSPPATCLRWTAPNPWPPPPAPCDPCCRRCRHSCTRRAVGTRACPL